MKILDIDGPLIQTLNKIADLMWLNILTIVFSIPLFTIGASFTALHYVALKMIRGEECYITKDYWKSFKENFLQSTGIWLIFVAMFAVLFVDYYAIVKQGLEISKIVQVAIVVIAVFVLFTFVMVFPVQAKFANPIGRTIKNAFVISIMQFPKTILMIIMMPTPIYIFMISIRILPLAVVFGFSVPALFDAVLYNKTFKKLEAQYAETHETVDKGADDEHIFSDEIVTADENNA
ncbi:MAG: DUF624 domain-containing protein [Lachnospiraceae bacterium]|nr:DUF624 domain-containing protein [Lachnospiraceae bacterium]